MKYAIYNKQGVNNSHMSYLHLLLCKNSQYLHNSGKKSFLENNIIQKKNFC